MSKSKFPGDEEKQRAAKELQTALRLQRAQKQIKENSVRGKRPTAAMMSELENAKAARRRATK